MNLTTPESRPGRSAGLVSGAGSGIGRAIAIELGRRGHPLVLLGRRRETLTETLRLAQAPGVAIAVDVRDEQALTAALKQAVHAGFEPGIVIPAAGVARVGPFETLDVQALRESIDTNLLGALSLYRGALPWVRAASDGHLFAILSAAAIRVFPGWSAYSASKWGLRGAFETLREELKGSGIRLTAIYPGATASPLWKDVPGEWDPAAMIPAEEVARAIGWALDSGCEVPEIHLQPRGGDL